MNTLPRCPWALHHELETTYHDTEWGVPVYNDQGQFEFLTLEAAQAGLSWLTILKKSRATPAVLQVLTLKKWRCLPRKM